MYVSRDRGLPTIHNSQSKNPTMPPAHDGSAKEAPNINVTAHNNDDIDSDFSDLDNPYQETALDWQRRNARRIAARRCGLSSDESDDSLDELEEENHELSCGFFDRWMKGYPLIAARCCLAIGEAPTRNNDAFDRWSRTRRRTARERETKQLRRVLRKMSKKRNEIRPDNADVASRENEVKHHQLVIGSVLPNGIGISFIDSVLSNTLPTKSSSNEKNRHTNSRTVLEIVSVVCSWNMCMMGDVSNHLMCQPQCNQS
jgi:hypothetical protein